MKLRMMAALGLSLALGACGSSDDKGTSGGVATVSGRLETSSDAGADATASIYSVGDDGQLSLVGSGSVGANGRFTIADVASGDGPFVVRIEDAATTTASVIVPQDLGSGDAVTTAPLNDETTVEADALLSIVAGSADTNDVDSVGLMTWIDTHLAADVDSNIVTSASLGAAFMAAQDGFVETAGSGTTAASMQSAELSAYTTLAVRLDTATTASATEQAWSQFHSDVSAKLTTALDLSADEQSDAVAAAGFLFQASLTGSDAANLDASRVAAVLSAYADLNAQLDAIDGSSAEADVTAKLNAAYDAWFQAAAQANTQVALGHAWEDLAANISGSGSVATDSALGILVNADANGQMDDAVNAIGQTAAASALLQAQLDSALQGEASARAAAVAQAYAQFRTQVAASVTASGSLSSHVQAFVEDTASQIGGHGSVVLDVDISGLLAGFHIGGIDLIGSVVAGMGFESGADAAFADTSFNALAGATTAVLVSITGNGQVSEVDQGDVTASGWSFDAVAQASGTLVVELRNAQGAITGAVILDGDTSGSGVVTVPVMTQETTVEAEVLLDLAADGIARTNVDQAWLEVMIDAAVAATVQDDGDVNALALAIEASSDVRAQLLSADDGEMHEAGIAALAELHAELMARGEAADASYADFRGDLEAAVREATSTSAEDYQRADTEAAVTFDMVVSAVAGADSDLAAAAEARARIESALALAASVDSAFDGSSFEASETAISAQVDAFISATHSASNAAQLDVAASAFVDAMTGGTSATDHGIIGDLGLNAVIQAALEASVTAAFQAAATFDASIQTAIGGATSGGNIDASAVATAVVSASHTFDAALDLTGSFGGADSQAMTTFVGQLALGFHDAQ